MVTSVAISMHSNRSSSRSQSKSLFQIRVNNSTVFFPRNLSCLYGACVCVVSLTLSPHSAYLHQNGNDDFTWRSGWRRKTVSMSIALGARSLVTAYKINITTTDGLVTGKESPVWNFPYYIIARTKTTRGAIRNDGCITTRSFVRSSQSQIKRIVREKKPPHSLSTYKLHLDHHPSDDSHSKEKRKGKHTTSQHSLLIARCPNSLFWMSTCISSSSLCPPAIVDFLATNDYIQTNRRHNNKENGSQFRINTQQKHITVNSEGRFIFWRLESAKLDLACPCFDFIATFPCNSEARQEKPRDSNKEEERGRLKDISVSACTFASIPLQRITLDLSPSLCIPIIHASLERQKLRHLYKQLHCPSLSMLYISHWIVKWCPTCAS